MGSVKNISGTDWMGACMIPKGNMMVSMLKKVEDGFNVFQFKCNDKEVKENLELEAEMKTFFEGGITKMVKDGKNLKLTTSNAEKIFTPDDMLKKQDEEKQKKLAEATKHRLQAAGDLTKK